MDKSIDPTSVDRWLTAVSRTEAHVQTLEVESLRRFALAIGADPAVERIHPPLAHWAYFLAVPTDSEIGPDGHVRRGCFMPDVSLPRRMFAGSRMQFTSPLQLARPGELVASIKSVEHKAGRAGDLVFVEVERVIRQLGCDRVREIQSFVYCEASEPMPLPVACVTPPAGEVWIPDAVNLFRFSAATFNSHRIHYDLAYATQVEGYPALLIHGPFTAAKLARIAMRSGPLATFAFKATAPLYLGQPIYLHEVEPGIVEAVRCDGIVAMRAEYSPR